MDRRDRTIGIKTMESAMSRSSLVTTEFRARCQYFVRLVL